MRGFRVRVLLFLALLSACDPNTPSGSDAVPGTLSPPESASVAPSAPAVPESSRPMMIDFTRDFCLPCQVMAPAVAELRQQHAGLVDVVEVNVDREKNERCALFFVVESVPTQVFVDASGRVVARHGGIATKEEMTRTLRELQWIP